MSLLPYFFRIFDLKKYREIEPIINGILDSSVDATQLKVLLKEASNIIEGDEFKKYNDKSMRYEYDIFQLMINLIDDNKFEEWKGTKYESMDDYYPENVALYLVQVLCCPKFQVSWCDDVPQSETTFEYIPFADAFYSPYSPGTDIYNILKQTGTESLPFLERGLYVFNRPQLAKFIKIVSDDYEIVRDPENTLYEVYEKNSNGQDNYIGLKLFSSNSFISEELGEEYYILPNRERQSKMTDSYEKIINFLRRVEPDFTILNDFWFS
jgi:hypothetical protein